MPRTRDADRSREAILAAAERLFSTRGYAGTSLGDIAQATGLSRATPSYFFGAKDELYAAVLERVFADRHTATERAFAPVRAWCEESRARAPALARALAEAADGYLRFLLARPAFVALVMREELDGGGRLASRPGSSTAMRDAFTMLRRAGRHRGLRAFDVDDAVLVFVALTYAPASHGATLMAALGRDLADDAVRRRHVTLVGRQTAALLCP
jgi:TetR/AcrR family transcriptional regulator